MCTKRRLPAAATLAITACLIALTALPAGAATPACGLECGSVFSRELGTYDRPGVVEAIHRGLARVGQPVILKQASSADPSQDIVPHLAPVSKFHEDGLVSAAVNDRYGDLLAVQQEYAPYGDGTELCVGLAGSPYQHQPLTLQPCGVSARTVWIIDTPDSHVEGYFPIVNAGTTTFERPFAMNIRRDEIESGNKTLHIRLARLQFLGAAKTLPDTQLWGFKQGVLG